MIGFIGGGNMAEALIKGIASSQGSVYDPWGVRGQIKNILVSEPRGERRKYLEQTYGVKTTQSNKDAASSCDIIILAIKPQDMEAALDEIAEVVTENKIVVSIAAGITMSYLTSKLKTKKFIRVMPNTPAIVQEGISVMSLCECFTDKDMATVKEIFMSVGKVLILPEKYMNAVTALSGSGPAFIAFFIEAMIDAGIKMGLRFAEANELAIQTLIGTAKLIETGMPPDKLRKMVTSPGGTTAAGLNVFVQKGFKDIVTAAIEAAVNRANELGKS